jgi:hypothetical protein
MEVAAIDQRDVDRDAAKPSHRLQAAEATADDDDSMPRPAARGSARRAER